MERGHVGGPSPSAQAPDATYDPGTHGPMRQQVRAFAELDRRRWPLRLPLTRVAAACSGDRSGEPQTDRLRPRVPGLSRSLAWSQTGCRLDYPLPVPPPVLCALLRNISAGLASLQLTISTVLVKLSGRC